MRLTPKFMGGEEAYQWSLTMLRFHLRASVKERTET